MNTKKFRRLFICLLCVSASCTSASKHNNVLCLCGSITDVQGTRWSKICFDTTFMQTTTTPTTIEYHVCKPSGEHPTK